MKKIVLLATLSIIGISTVGNAVSVSADELQPEQTTLVSIEQESTSYDSNIGQHNIRKRDNMDVQGINWGGKRPSKGQQTCAKGVATGILGGVTSGIPGMISGGILGAIGACTG